MTGEVDYQYVNEEQSIVSYAELSPSSQVINSLASLSPFYEITAGPSNTQSQELELLKLIFQIGRSVLIAIKTTGSVSGTVTVNWFEQQ